MHTNIALTHFSYINYFITTHKIFDCFIEKVVIYDVQKSFSHNIAYFCISVFNFKHMIDTTCNLNHVSHCNLSKASVEHIEFYQLSLNNSLSLIDINISEINCHNLHCEYLKHSNSCETNLLCSILTSVLMLRIKQFL